MEDFDHFNPSPGASQTSSETQEQAKSKSQAFRYDLYKEDGQLSDVSSTSPDLVIAIWRLKFPVTFDRKKNASFSSIATADGVRLRGDGPLIITDDCYSLTVTHSKGSPTGNLKASLFQSENNYLSSLLPGDWVMAWMLNDTSDTPKLIEKIKKNGSDNLNSFNSGLKFVGRLNEVRKKTKLEGRTGKRTSRYTISATSFKELNTQIFYHQALAEAAIGDITHWMAKIGLDIKKLFKNNKRSNSDRGLGDNAEALILNLFEIILGSGPTRGENGLNVKEAKGISPAAGSGLQDTGAQSAPFALLVPKAVANSLGGGGELNSDVSYASICTILTGRQTYSANDVISPERGFQPNLDPGAATGNRLSTGDPVLGSFLPLPINFINTPIWAMINQFVNPAINEMYTTLRVNESGAIVPTIVLRQIPFTTESYNESYTGSNNRGVTKFLSLPRWVLSAKMIPELDIGRSDTTRFNFVHIGVMTDNQRGIGIEQQWGAGNHPIFDNIDIQRSGIHPYVRTVCADVRDQTEKEPSFWMSVVADHAIGGHLSANGQVTSYGIQAPICVGDNAEIEGVVYHIEQITHSIQISEPGIKSFWTTLSLSNGMSLEEEGTEIESLGVGEAKYTGPSYPGLRIESSTSLDAGITTMAAPNNKR